MTLLARTLAATLLPATLLGAPAATKPAAIRAADTPTIRIVSPAAETYISGATRIEAQIAPSAAPVERVSLFADGRLVCHVDRAPFACDWDAGSDVREHVIRAVGLLSDGTRIVTSARTKGVSHAESVDVHVVQVSVLVKDRAGNVVKGLKASDFRLREDDLEQRITNVADDQSPLELVMALDISASMTGVIDDLKTSSRKFLSALRPSDAVAILGFNDNVFTVVSRTAAPDVRSRALDRLAPWGATSLYDVISRGVGMLQRQSGRKGLVVFSDGDDESSRLPLEVVEREVLSSDATLYAVGLGRATRADDLKAVLERLSVQSGGRVVLARDARGLSAAFTDVVQDLAHQYVLSFAPSNDRRDGTWRKLSVEVPGKNYTLRARRGYLARPAPESSR